MILEAALIAALIPLAAAPCHDRGSLPDFSPESGLFDWKDNPIPATGTYEDGLKPIDDGMKQIMRDMGLPGAGFAICVKGEIVFARGYGYAILEDQTPFTADTTSRLSSITKPVIAETAKALMKLGFFDEDTKVVPFLRRHGLDPIPPPGGQPDPRLHEITVKQLMEHRSGIWTGDLTDAVFKDLPGGPAAYHEIGKASEDAAIRVALGRPLLCAPGEKENYSNCGYDVLAKFLAIQVSEHFHLPFDKYVLREVLSLHCNPKPWHLMTGRKDSLLPGEAYCYLANQGGPNGKYSLVYADLIRHDLHKGSSGWATSARALATYFDGLMPHGYYYVFNGWNPGDSATMRVYPEGAAYGFVTNFSPPNRDANGAVRDRIGPMVQKFLGAQGLSRKDAKAPRGQQPSGARTQDQ